MADEKGTSKRDSYQSLGPTPPNQPPKTQRSVLWWWLIMLGLIAWNLMSFWPKTNPEVNLPYSTFSRGGEPEQCGKSEYSG